MRIPIVTAALGLATASRAENIINVVANGNGDVDIGEGTFESIYSALEVAFPGDTIVLEAGSYFEDIKSVRSGLEEAPITISGPTSAVIHGGEEVHSSEDSIIAISHDDIHLVGFTINGIGNQEEDGSLDQTQYREHLIHVQNNLLRYADSAPHVHSYGVKNFRAEGLTLTQAGGSCVKLSNFVTHSELIGNNILHCGQNPAVCVGKPGCGSGIDLGTTVSRRMENAGGEDDQTSWNTISKNFISDVGDACIHVNEGSQFNILNANSCLSSLNADGAGLMIRGDANVVRFNLVTGATGAGLGLGGAQEEYHTYGVFNQVYGNQLAGNAGGSLLGGILQQPTGVVCGNKVQNDEDYEGDPLTMECPDYVDTSITENLSADSSNVMEGLPGKPGDPKSTMYSCIEKTASRVISSEVDKDKPGISPSVLQQDTESIWSRFGIGQWVEFNLDAAAGPPTIEAVEITFYKGDTRVQNFKILADGKVVLDNGASSGVSTDPQLFMLPLPAAANKIRIVCGGNRPNDEEKQFSLWNSLERVRLCQTTPDGSEYT